MPRLWNQTIEEHRHAVHAAILDVTAALVTEHGLAAVTMSRIAQDAGIGRATLYKYFPDVESILVAWHERQITDHLGRLSSAGSGSADAFERLTAVLRAYATLSAGHGAPDMVAALHRGEHVTRARRQLLDFIGGLVAEAASAGHVRTDVPAQELAAFCVHAMNAAIETPPADRPATTDRLLAITLAALRPPAVAPRTRKR